MGELRESNKIRRIDHHSLLMSDGHPSIWFSFREPVHSKPYSIHDSATQPSPTASVVGTFKQEISSCDVIEFWRNGGVSANGRHSAKHPKIISYADGLLSLTDLFTRALLDASLSVSSLYCPAVIVPQYEHRLTNPTVERC